MMNRSAVTDLHFNPQELLTVLSCSDESSNSGGGTVEIWRPHELLMIDVTKDDGESNKAISELTSMLKKKYECLLKSGIPEDGDF